MPFGTQTGGEERGGESLPYSPESSGRGFDHFRLEDSLRELRLKVGEIHFRFKTKKNEDRSLSTKRYSIKESRGSANGETN